MTDPETQQREKRALTAAIKELGVPGRIITLDGYLREGLST